MCPACEGDRFVAIPITGLTLRRCVGCGLFAGVFPESKEAGYGSIDSEAYRDSIGFVRRTQSESIVALVREHLADGDWLDVGCGYGYAVEAAGAAGYSARGIEPNMVAAEMARNRGVNVTHGVLSDETPPADVVSTLDVLEHLEDINSFAKLVKRKTRGLWVIKVPSSDGLFFRIAHTFRIAAAVDRLWQARYEHPHRVYFNEQALHAFLGKHGFDIVGTRYLQEIPTRTAVARLTLDGATPRWKARLAVPAIAAINLVERLRARSDALLIIARRH
jgi:2-polyprenyl-3-methyl-5-hydroxy-6-metoxy-1,4-benzoquinol methylase